MVRRTCLECNTIFETSQKYINRGHGKFCSTSCAAKYGNKKRKKSPNTKCTLCGKPLFRLPNQLRKFKNHYCNRECKSKAEYKVGKRGSRKKQRRLGSIQKEKLLKKNY